ncbi:MAG TPA: SpaA isopeptide-forming pilin-related protein, partial [Bacteroidales bacterium]|nr:SpaA isopeptide-forming pilin-related protein [Bacteroidales bacterium]
GESTAVATKSIIYIVDENGAALPGVQFKILDSNGQEVAIGTNGNIYTAVNRKLIVKGLPVGEYTLKNVSVPEGYLQPEDKQFTVYKDAVRVARVEIQRNIPRGSLQLSTTYLTESGDTRYASRSKYKVVDTATGELVKFTKTNTGDYIASNLETALEVISLKSGTVTLEGIKVGNYQISLTDVTSGFGLTSTEPASVNIVENTEQKLNTEVKRAGIKQIDAEADHTMYLDYNGDLWLLGSGDEGLLYNGSNTGSKYYNPIPTKIQFPNDTKISKFSIAKDHIIAIDTKGKVWSWGSNNTYGELGRIGTSEMACASEIDGNPLKQAYDDGIKIIDVATTYDNSVLLDSNGKVWTCGYG